MPKDKQWVHLAQDHKLNLTILRKQPYKDSKVPRLVFRFIFREQIDRGRHEVSADLTLEDAADLSRILNEYLMERLEELKFAAGFEEDE